MIINGHQHKQTFWTYNDSNDDDDHKRFLTPLLQKVYLDKLGKLHKFYIFKHCFIISFFLMASYKKFHFKKSIEIYFEFCKWSFF